MASVFTKIIAGELPGRFVWSDETAVGFLSINPITTGHTLVVPRVEVDHWLDLEPSIWQHCAAISQHIGSGIQRALNPPRVGQMIAGFEVPHVHVHVLAVYGLGDLSFANAQADPDPSELDAAADAIRVALRELGFVDAVPSATSA